MLSGFNWLTYIFIFFSQLDNFFHNFNFIVYFALNYFNYRIYQLSSKEKRNILFKKVSKYKFICNKYDENNEPIGIIIHKNMIPHFLIFNRSYHQDILTIICKNTFYKELSEEIKIKQQIQLDEEFIPCKKHSATSKNVNYITKRGEYGYFEYGIRVVNLENMSIHKTLTFYDTQKKLFRDIMNFYKHNHFCKVYLSGKPGCGKTFFAYLMAQTLDCYLCDVYKGNEPSSNFNEIYTRARVSSEKPMIVIFDEVDIMISEINNNVKNEHKKYNKEIYDKTSWNFFMDKIEYGMFPYVIILMTSNKRHQDINKYDTSYLRNGRVNIVCEW
uniref:ATPase AAA-type core domain-containing protein n=1 Tax=viral metagenome TaxID=1070528 RepID=A0A6C0KXS6_9ZZZZ